MFRSFLSNHVLANLAFALVLIVGSIIFMQLPREKDPEINFNWINILTILPGASAIDVEKRITDPIEDAINRSISDINFVSSTSRESVSNILVRFNQLDEREFDKRVADLRREVQNAYTDQLPDDADDPSILEITSSNGFATATIVLRGLGSDEGFRMAARNIRDEIERIRGVDSASALGLYEPELQVQFYPDKLSGLGISPSDIADTVRSYFRDVSIGDLETADGKWVVRLQGTDNDPGILANYPIVTAQGVVPLSAIADIVLTTEEPAVLVRYNGEPAINLTITKTADTNVLELMDTLRDFVDRKNELSSASGIEVHLVDDQTVSTREALSLMQNNALIGLMFVLFVTWLFLGTRIAIFTSIGIPFTMAGTFIILYLMGMTLNNSVLLGVVIALGMIVDDAVVVVEAIYYRMSRGAEALDAAIDSLKEVFAPVTTSVLTTVAAFLPLTLLPGILGDFMRVIPLTVCVALLFSLLEAYWMLPVHVASMKNTSSNPSKIDRQRSRITHLVRVKYTQLLVKTMRHPWIAFASVIVILVLSFAILLVSLIGGKGPIRMDFFAADAIRQFYVNVEMPRDATLEETMEVVLDVETKTVALINDNELRASVSYAGQMFTQTEPLFGDNVGQVMVSLKPANEGGRDVLDIADIVEAEVANNYTGADITLLRLEDGPPVDRPIAVKVIGDEFEEIRRAAQVIEDQMVSTGIYTNITQDYRAGNAELLLKHDGEAIQRLGISPTVVTRALQAYVDGELITQFQSNGEEVMVRVKAKQELHSDVDQLLRQSISLPNGQSVALGDLVEVTYTQGLQNIRHYNFRRTITLESDIVEAETDTVQANRLIVEHWETIREDFPTISLDFSGELDDIQESISSLLGLFIMGVGIIYVILGTQFRSYWQPLIIIFGTLPLAMTGVIIGLLITRNAVSLYTLYGIVALMGIAVNAAIVLISAANDRLAQGMSLDHAILFAARRRVIPIIITSLTTVAGLFSLAVGLAGESLVWGPVAMAIVSGLSISTLLTLFVIPLIYRILMGIALGKSASDHTPSIAVDDSSAPFPSSSV
jgi:multidrug efflux pump subunit AcrB